MVFERSLECFFYILVFVFLAVSYNCSKYLQKGMIRVKKCIHVALKKKDFKKIWVDTTSIYKKVMFPMYCLTICPSIALEASIHRLLQLEFEGLWYFENFCSAQISNSRTVTSVCVHHFLEYLKFWKFENTSQYNSFEMSRFYLSVR